MASEFRIPEDESLRFDNRLCVSNNAELKREIMTEAYNSAYTAHFRSTKIYKDLRENF